MKRTRRPPVPGQAAAGPPNPWRIWAPLLLALAILIAYSNSFRSGLVFDNAVLIAQDARVHAWTPHNLFLILTGGYWFNRADPGLYRPLTTLSYLLNYAAFGNGLQPAAYHCVNLALHEINVMLVYALGMLLFGKRGPAFALAAIWGLHPVHTEAVTNIVGRADLLAAFGVLAGVLCYARYRQSGGRRRFAWLAGLAASQTIGIFSKESAVVLPVILLVFDSMTGEAAGWRRRLPAYGTVAVPLAAYLAVRIGLGIHLAPDYFDNPIAGAGLLAGRMTAFEVLGKLVWLLVWPARLSADYSYRAIPLLGWQNLVWGSLLALLLAATLVAATWLAVSRKGTASALYFFALFFWIAYLPVSNLLIPIGSIMGERFLYLPSVGLLGWAVAAVVRWKLPARLHIPERARWAVPAALCLAFAARTYARNPDWTDERSLWASAVMVSPESARAHVNLGTALPPGATELSRVIAEFEAALRIRPDYAEAHNNLCNALQHVPDRLPDAIAECQAALRVRPDYAEAHNALGNALQLLPNRLPDAIAEYQAALRIRPDYAEAHTNLGNLLLHQPDRLADAIAEYQSALRLRPDYAEAHYGLGLALLQVPGRLADAMGEFLTALDLRPGYAEVHNDLGRAYLQTPGRLPDAIAQFKAALRTRPDLVDARYNLGNALLMVPGRASDAVEQYRTALRVGPDLAEGHYDLARALLQIPDRAPDAIHELETALRLKPDLAEAHYNLAIVLRQTPGRQAEASREMAAALRINPGLGRTQK